MPTISQFFGVAIRMNFVDHQPPHFHAEYQGFSAMFDIETGDLRAGNFPTRLKAVVTMWARQHKDELIKNWKNAQKRKALFQIPGADQDE